MVILSFYVIERGGMVSLNNGVVETKRDDGNSGFTL